MSFKHNIKRLGWRFGIEMEPFTVESSTVQRRRRLMAHAGIDLVIDVGANIGKYGRRLREDVHYRGRIASFEPLEAAFESLRQEARNDPGWQVFNCALGDEESESVINVARNSESSSILDMLPQHKKAAPESAYYTTQKIKVRTLDSVFPEIRKDARRIYLKIDTQGYESKVLAGGRHSLPHVSMVQMEMSLAPLYSNELLFADMLGVMQGLGFRLIGLETGFCDPVSGHVLQADGFFTRD